MESGTHIQCALSRDTKVFARLATQEREDRLEEARAEARSNVAQAEARRVSKTHWLGPYPVA